MNLLDWLLVVLVLAYALSGYWQGFITGACATAGLLLGGLAGIWLAPLALGDADPSLLVSLGALFIVILGASLGQAALQYAGARLRERITWQPARAVDAVGGAALSAVAVLLVAWALGVAVSGSSFGSVTQQVRGSAVLAEVDEVLPASASGALQSFNNVVGTGFFPRYLEPFSTERIVDVPAPTKKILDNAKVRGAEGAVVKIRGTNDCSRGVEGSGFVIGPDRVMTNAHVVAGVDDPSVEIGGETRTARVVLYDPDLDLAVLSVETGSTTPLQLADGDGGAESGDSVAILGYPQDGPFDVQPARIRDAQRLRSPDIYGDGTVLRDVYALYGLVRPGNSGGPVLDKDGDVAGVVFAASVTDPDTGYAITADQAADTAQTGLDASAEVSTGDCAD